MCYDPLRFFPCFSDLFFPDSNFHFSKNSFEKNAEAKRATDFFRKSLRGVNFLYYPRNIRVISPSHFLTGGKKTKSVRCPSVEEKNAGAEMRAGP